MRSLDRKTEQTQANRTFYGAGLVTSLTGVAAIAAAVESAWFFLLAASLVAGGYFVSIRLRARGKNLRIVETAVIAICLATYARLFATGETSPLLSPGLAMSHKELALAVMLVWAEVVRSFSLVSDDSLLFTAVPSLALIGVVATTSPGGDTLAYFSIWLCSSITMFIESGKSGQERMHTSASARAVSTAVALGVGSVAAGMLMSPLLQQTATQAFVWMAPDVYTARHGAELALDNESNTLEISEGPVRLSSRIVMTVKTRAVGEQEGTGSKGSTPPVYKLPASGYWRSRVWDNYTGREWRSSAEPIDATGMFSLFSGDGSQPGGLQTQSVEDPADALQVSQTFTLSADPGQYLPALAEAYHIQIEQGHGRPVRDTFNSWHVPGASERSLTRRYRVFSSVADPDPDALRKASDRYPKWLLDGHYLDLEPPFISRRVQELARKVTRPYHNNYDKMLALQKVLSRTCTYDLQTPPIPTRERDAVDYFLFQSKRGYCDLFATALATMARSVGIPARIATGYIQGDYDNQQQAWIVRDKDKHSWAEVFFPGYGWIPFEATPSDSEPAPGYWEAVWNELSHTLTDRNPRVLFLLAALGIGIIGLRLLIIAEGHPRAHGRERQQRSEMRHAQRIWRKLASELRRLGVETRASESPVEMARRAERLLGDDREAWDALMQSATLLGEVLYGRGYANENRMDQLRAALRIAQIHLRRHAAGRPAGRRSRDRGAKR